MEAPIIRICRPLFLTFFLLLSACDTPFESPKRQSDFFYDEGVSAYGEYLVGKFSYLHGAFEESADHMKDAVIKEPDSLQVAHAALIPMLLAGDFEETEQLVARLIGTKFEDEIVRIAHLTYLIGRRSYKEALTFLKDSPPQKEAFGLVTPLIELWLNQGMKEKVNTAPVMKLIEKSSTPEIYHYHLGNLYALQENFPEAKKAYQQVLKAPTNFSFRQVEVISTFFKKQGELEEAERFITAFKKSQADPYVYQYFVNHLKEPNTPATPLTSIKRNIAEIYIQFAATLIDTVALDLGIVFLKLTHFLEPDFELEKALYATAIQKRGLYNDVLMHIADISPKSPYIPFFTLAEIDAQMGLKQEETALLTIEGELQKHPNWAYLYARKGVVETSQKYYEKATSSFTSALNLMEKVPDDFAKMRDTHLANYHFLRGGAFERLNKWDKAEPDLERSLEINPNQPLVLNYLGYSWVDRGKNIENALTYIQKALKMLPLESAFIDSLGWAYYKLKRYKEAATLLEKALLISPDDPEMHFHLGDIYEALGRHTEAQFEWKKSLFFVEDEEMRTELKSRLKP